jgi:hypothetical protein
VYLNQNNDAACLATFSEPGLPSCILYANIVFIQSSSTYVSVRERACVRALCTRESETRNILFSFNF